MAWETRNGRGRYYTRSRRVNGRVARQYIGAGIAGELAAREDAERRAKRDKQRAAWITQKTELLAIEDLLDAYSGTLFGLTGAVLLHAGFHRHHRGEWRKRRDR